MMFLVLLISRLRYDYTTKYQLPRAIIFYQLAGFAKKKTCDRGEVPFFFFVLNRNFVWDSGLHCMIVCVFMIQAY